MTAVRDRFRVLHERGLFLLPNPWDVGSARELGVRRISTGGSPAWAACGALRDAARELQQSGTTSFRDHVLTAAEIDRALS